MKGLTLSREEQRRVQVLNQVLERRVSVGEAAELLGVSERHGWRLLAAYRKEGAAALAHGNRGRSPVHTTPGGLREQVRALAAGRYAGCNHCQLTELLAEREGIARSRSTVRRILLEAGLRSPRRRRPPKHRSRRERMAREGMLLQVDGSRHPWLEGRGPWLTLVAAIDDATGQVVAAQFREQEDAQGYLLLLEEILRTKGVPLALYSDRHGIFQRSPREPETLAEQLQGERAPTQFGRALCEVGIQAIFARSPQAKGRIERLWGTWQDRLVMELRLAQARTLQEAQQVLQTFLPRFNAQFAVPAAQEGSAYRTLPLGLDVETVCCFKYRRTVGQDNTVRLGVHRVQLLPDRMRSSYARAVVEVQERLDGSLAVSYQGRCLTITSAPPEAPLLRARPIRRPGPATTLTASAQEERAAGAVGRWATPTESESAAVAHVSTPPKPSPDHPWRRSYKRRH